MVPHGSEPRGCVGRPPATTKITDEVMAKIAVSISHYHVSMKQAANVALLWMTECDGFFFFVTI
jgi:hypothetical protein